MCGRMSVERTYNRRKFTFDADDDDLSENSVFFATTAQMLIAHSTAFEQRKATDKRRVRAR